MKSQGQKPLQLLSSELRMVAWEVTRSCNLACVHCRASSVHGPYKGELDTARCLSLLDEIVAFSRPVIILTGGEPLLREDIFTIASYGNRKGLRMVMATNGTLVTDEMAVRIRESGIRRVSISIDGRNAKSHDAFRAVPGAFQGALDGIKALKKAGVEFQINTTVTKANLPEIEDILNLSLAMGAAAHHIFLLVPTGRGKDMAGREISPEDYEKTLNWFYETGQRCSIQLKATCAPHYYRIYHQRKKGGAGKKPDSAHPLHAMTRGCLGGSSFCFISHTGRVQPCGYLDLDCGQVREKRFEEIWRHSAIINDLRDLSRYKGKCGRCEFIRVCGGCRARAYELTGDYLMEEPLCSYHPGGRRGSGK
jgi:heme b synthase